MRPRINTLKKLREYIFRKLGAPTLRVELLNDQVDDCIYQALEKFSYYAYDGTQQSVLVVNLEPGLLRYQLPYRTQAVTGFHASSKYNSFTNIPQGYMLDINPIALRGLSEVSNSDTIEMSSTLSGYSNMKSIFDVKPKWNFNTNSCILTLGEEPSSSVMMLQLESDYEPAEVDKIFDNHIIKQYAEGLAWIQLSTIHGKYGNATLINGSEANYDNFQTKGEAMVDKAMEEMMGLMRPLGIYRG